MLAERPSCVLWQEADPVETYLLITVHDLVNGVPRTPKCSWEHKALWPLQHSKISLYCIIPHSLAVIKYSQWSKDACPLFLQCIALLLQVKAMSKEGCWRDPHLRRIMAQTGDWGGAESELGLKFRVLFLVVIGCHFLSKSFNYLIFKT